MLSEITIKKKTFIHKMDVSEIGDAFFRRQAFHVQFDGKHPISNTNRDQSVYLIGVSFFYFFYVALKMPSPFKRFEYSIPFDVLWPRCALAVLMFGSSAPTSPPSPHAFRRHRVIAVDIIIFKCLNNLIYIVIVCETFARQ